MFCYVSTACMSSDTSGRWVQPDSYEGLVQTPDQHLRLLLRLLSSADSYSTTDTRKDRLHPASLVRYSCFLNQGCFVI